MDNTSVNFDVLHTFVEGLRGDFENHAESNKAMIEAVNGRLFSENGVLSYSSLKGTKKIYENPDIKKYLGYFAFKDELILFTKCAKDLVPPVVVCTENLVVTVSESDFSSDTDTISNLNFDSLISSVSVETCVPEVPVDENDFSQSVSCADDVSNIDDYGDLFQEYPMLPLVYCSINSIDVPVNNEVYGDAIWSLKYNSQGNLEAKLLYYGNLNWSWDAKICAIGLEENAFKKPVYFTDYGNPVRFINIKDQSLLNRNPDEFLFNISGTILNPKLKQINENGSLKAMSVVYMYRLISENGQVSDFSATSEMIKINKDDGDFEYSGGNVTEITNKSVVISCIVPSYLKFSEIQLIAVEFEAENVPTSIKVVGRKEVNFYNEFEHFGSEPEFTENIALSDIFANSISWKYASDLGIKNNKMIAVGLRNDPSFISSKNVDVDFALHGFNYSDGTTHGCLLNPDPVKYQYIDRLMNQPFMYVNKKIFRTIEVFGNFWMRLQNKITGDFYQLTVSNAPENYADRTQQILEFLFNLYENEPDFASNFPNLKFAQSVGKILFLPINDGIQTDFSNYNLLFSTSQAIVDYDNSFETLNYAWPPAVDNSTRLVYGGVSNGWFNGNGVRVSMSRKYDHVLDKNTNWHNGSGPVLQIKKPTLLKGVMKGEIYRLGIQWFKNGNRLFTTILGDIKIPEFGQKIREILPNGSFDNVPSAPIANTKYKNFKIEGSKMLAERIELMFDVRISCELSSQVDSYQIVYVERTENNRTILAQGMTAPLQRMNQFRRQFDVVTDFPEVVTNKWNLPYYGGPIHDAEGLIQYDLDPNVENVEEGDYKKRIITNRKLISFDAPDLIYNRISDQNIENSFIEFVESVATDHDKFNIASGYNKETSNNANENGVGSEIVQADGSGTRSDITVPFGNPKFSQKIPYSSLGGNGDHKPFFVNASVYAQSMKRKTHSSFSNTLEDSNFYAISNAESANNGEILSAFRMNETFDVSNNAAVLGVQAWWYQERSRYPDSAEQSSFRVNNLSTGRPTVFIKTMKNFYSDENINQAPYTIRAYRSFGTASFNNWNTKGFDAQIIGNVRRKNQDSVYGGRTEFAYASNEYIAMSDVIPVISNNVTSQVFNAQGDTYCNLFIRNKNSYIDVPVPASVRFAYNDNNNDQYNRYGAWCYAVVLESTVEPRLNYSEEFYRQENDILFKMGEDLNPAYMNINNFKKSIPKPYKFKDDPNQSNTIAVSDPKVAGDYYDAFTKFRTNEFYELDKDKGAALNIAKEKDTIFVIQELQTCQIQIDEKNFITPDEGGKAIQIAQGDGSSISGHEVVSDYGTSIRRAVVNTVDFGFTFFDERKKEVVKIIKPLFIENMISLLMNDFYTANEVVDSEGYYDPKFKETNIRLRTKTGQNFIISYNEVMKCFNGKYMIDNDMYPVFQEKAITPYADSAKLGELNSGNILEFFELPKQNMFIGIITNADPIKTKIEKGIAVSVNINYPIKKTTFETSLGNIREILGTHTYYKIREGVHTLPALNEMDTADIRGEWIKVLLEIESIDNKKINVFSIVNYLRNSYK